MICRLRAERRARGEEIYCWGESLRKSGADPVGTRPCDANYDYGQVAAIILTADTSSVRALLADAPAALRPAASGLVAVAPAAPLVAVAPAAPLVAPAAPAAAA